MRIPASFKLSIRCKHSSVRKRPETSLKKTWISPRWTINSQDKSQEFLRGVTMTLFAAPEDCMARSVVKGAICVHYLVVPMLLRSMMHHLRKVTMEQGSQRISPSGECLPDDGPKCSRQRASLSLSLDTLSFSQHFC